MERTIQASDVVELLAQLFRLHGEPEYIRSDNGPEFMAAAVKEWLASSGVKTLYIEPGSPWQNAYSETFNSRFEDELLHREIFTSLMEAKVLVEQYRVAYQHERPHSSLGYRTPAEFVAEPALALGQGAASHACGVPALDLRRWEEEMDLTLEPALS